MELQSGDEAMCEKCSELDDRIAHYVRLGSRITDKLTSEAIVELVERMKAEKVALHSESER
jgi:hypothetical protein